MQEQNLGLGLPPVWRMSKTEEGESFGNRVMLFRAGFMDAVPLIAAGCSPHISAHVARMNISDGGKETRFLPDGPPTPRSPGHHAEHTAKAA